MSATAYRRSTVSILTALQTALEAVTLTIAGASASAFQRVELFDLQSFPDALKELLFYEQRICVLVPGEETFPTQISGRLMIVQRRLPVTLLIADRKIGDRQAALYGDDANVPGAYALVEAVLPAVAGQLLSNPYGVHCTPETTTLVAVTEGNKPDPGRAAVALDLVLTGGRLEATLDSSPVL